MPKRIAVEMKCDRCKAIWYEDYTPGDPEPATASLELTLKIPLPEAKEVLAERKVKYEVLCKRCESTVANYIDGVELDPDARKKPKAKKGEEARAQGDAQRRPPEPKSSAPRPTQRASSGGEARRRATSESPDRAS